jgi:hypothetical protein
MVILSDGRVVSCEADFAGRQCVGRIGADAIGELWTRRLAGLREAHRAGQFGSYPLCQSCSDWHRP